MGDANHASWSGQLNTVVIYDGGASDWSPEDVQSVLQPVEAVTESLRGVGHDVTPAAVLPDLAWLGAVRDADLVFNLCEGIGGVSQLEYKVASAIELCGVPYTGARAWTMTLCHRKPLLNAVLQASGLPIPRWRALESTHQNRLDVPLPAIVKPAAEDASVGIDQGSVVDTPDALLERIRHLAAQQFSEIMVQEYIAGREVAVGFVGRKTLPISEIDFTALPAGAWPIISFAAKWKPGSPEDVGTKPICPAHLDPDLADRVTLAATRAWQAVRGTGYGRVDLRIDAEGKPWVIEVNPNPDLSTDAGLARMAQAAGWSYDELVQQIVEVAVEEQPTLTDALTGFVTGSSTA